MDGRATQRDGGRKAPASRLDNMVQVMLRVGRILLLRIRCGFIYKPGVDNTPWKELILSDVTLSAEGLQLMMKASANTRRRLKNCFLGKLPLGPRIPQVPEAGHLDWLEQGLEGRFVVRGVVAAGGVVFFF